MIRTEGEVKVQPGEEAEAENIVGKGQTAQNEVIKGTMREGEAEAVVLSGEEPEAESLVKKGHQIVAVIRVRKTEIEETGEIAGKEIDVKVETGESVIRVEKGYVAGVATEAVTLARAEQEMTVVKKCVMTV